MTEDASSWRREWVIDVDPLAAAQARHIPTAFGMTLERIDAIAVERGSRPYVAALCADDSQELAEQHARAAGQRVNDWIGARGKQALALWRELELDLDPRKVLVEPLPCEVRSWRQDWTTRPRGDGVDLPDLVHSSGFAVHHVWRTAAEGVRAGWHATVPSDDLNRVTEALVQHSDRKIKRLSQEAAILWMELGYFDSSPTKVADPFGDDWRSLWHVRESAGKQWIVHPSGLALQPVHRVVDGSGIKAWSLDVEDYGFDVEMQHRVGRKAWRRLHDQGWKLCEELGYLDSGPRELH